MARTAIAMAEAARVRLKVGLLARKRLKIAQIVNATDATAVQMIERMKFIKAYITSFFSSLVGKLLREE